MKREGIQPVTRTYNTLMIACNTSNQWQESLRVYDELLASGQPPNTTTYNALISAHSKGGDLPRVLQVFREMVQRVSPRRARPAGPVCHPGVVQPARRCARMPRPVYPSSPRALCGPRHLPVVTCDD